MPATQVKNQPARRSAKAGDSEERSPDSYPSWTRQDLLQRAHQLGICGRSAMTRSQLIDALRDH
ncbi:MAG TPA: hypothetical protein VFV73_05240 [Streptosporangiaceae bacterium]|nr:hypothetical protein [Streptosporangiaceae bacterium]